jgi:hypothetical protein
MMSRTTKIQAGILAKKQADVEKQTRNLGSIEKNR